MPDLPPALQLPRPGYEGQTLRIGGGTLASSLAVGLRHDDNIFATNAATVSDEILVVVPRLVLDSGQDRLRVNAELFGDIRLYLRTTEESRYNFGGLMSARWVASGRWQLSGKAVAQRAVESRNDPEAAPNLGLPPRRINNFGGEVVARYGAGRFGVGVTGRIERYDFLPPEDADRTLTSYNASVRFSLAPSTELAFILEPYVTRRDHDLPFDRSGTDRDTTTVGMLAGVRVGLTGTLDGEVAVGAFRALPDDARRPAFSGLAANADLRWTPRRRTAITARARSGDVATVVIGAIGRTDRFLGLQIDQEARHNLLLQMQLSWRESRFRGIETTFATTGIEAGVEYLASRSWSVVLEFSHAQRRADLPTDRFRRNYAGLALRWRH